MHAAGGAHRRLKGAQGLTWWQPYRASCTRYHPVFCPLDGLNAKNVYTFNTHLTRHFSEVGPEAGLRTHLLGVGSSFWGGYLGYPLLESLGAGDWPICKPFRLFSLVLKPWLSSSCSVFFLGLESGFHLHQWTCKNSQNTYWQIDHGTGYEC